MRGSQRTGVIASILSYNSWETLEQVLRSVAQQEVRPDRVVVVDNASTDGTADRLLEVDGIEAVVLSENRGVGAGHNRGIDIALDDESCQFVWLLEHDSIPSRDCLSILLRANSQLIERGRSVGALMPRAARDMAAAVRRPTSDDPHRYTNFTFNGVLISRSTVESVGPIRTDFFLGLEDIEYAERIRKAGLEVLVVPTSLLLHGTVGQRRLGIRPSVLRSYYSTRNSVYFEFRLRGRVFAAPEFLARAMAGALRSLISEDHKAARVAARFTATLDGLTGRMGRRDYWFLSPSKGPTRSVETT